MRALMFAAALFAAGCSSAPEATVWRFDRLDTIGGAAAKSEGHPVQTATAAGPAVSFNGNGDALFIDAHPLAGAEAFTVEAVFRPEGGPFEQRWLHLAEADPKTGLETGTRMLMEIRVIGGRWYFDAFTRGQGYNQTLIAPEKTFPIGPWYRVAMSCDGTMFRAYVDGVLQAEAPVACKPQGAGRSSLGVRINKIDWFKGSVHSVRFTPKALAPEEFAPLPDGLNPPVK